MRVVFLGSPEFSLNCLKQILAHHEVVAVVTQPDAPAGRGQKLVKCPVAEFAIKNSLNLYQFEKISRDGVDILKSLKPDIMVTCAYGQILSQEVIDIAKHGIINVHASLLPKYRGASPIQSAIINGEKETGITIMQTEAGLDTGDIILFEKVAIGDDETSGELTERLSEVGARLVIIALDQIANGTAEFTKQKHTDATTTKKLNKINCTINFNRTSEQINNLVRGANPDPIARATINGESVKIYKTRVRNDLVKDAPNGTVLDCSSAKAGLFISCGVGVIEVLEIQFPGGKVISGANAIGGRKISVGQKFDDFGELLI
ncbi:MAG: methionyl-tRNA formyltransferase [Clostridia bacterium]|nr:methionyl-tRNA formyltransferase [Clostridia bacterium]